MVMERPQVNIRLERDLLDELDDMAAEESLDRTELARRLLREGLRRERIEIAVRRHREGMVTAARAAELARVSLYEMLERIHQDGIPYDLEPQELVAATGQLVTAARERPASYGSVSAVGEGDIDELRAQFRPERVRWLFVGESSPAGGTHFYRANSNLFRATQEAFATAFGADVPSGEAFLHDFRARGGWLVDLADRPVNRLAAAERRFAIQAGAGRLTGLIAETQPARIVVVKASIAPSVEQAASAAAYGGPIAELPFPVRQWRAVYIRDLAAVLVESGPAPRVGSDVMEVVPTPRRRQ